MANPRIKKKQKFFGTKYRKSNNLGIKKKRKRKIQIKNKTDGIVLTWMLVSPTIKSIQLIAYFSSSSSSRFVCVRFFSTPSRFTDTALKISIGGASWNEQWAIPEEVAVHPWICSAPSRCSWFSSSFPSSLRIALSPTSVISAFSSSKMYVHLPNLPVLCFLSDFWFAAEKSWFVCQS